MQQHLVEAAFVHKVPGAQDKGPEDVFLPASAHPGHRCRSCSHVNDKHVFLKGPAACVDCACGIQGQALAAVDVAAVAADNVAGEQMDMMPGCHMGKHGLSVGTLSYDVGRGMHVDDGVNAPGYEVQQGGVACAVHVPEGMG